MLAWVPLTLLCAACTPVRDPPATLIVRGLPVSGSLADAQRSGFTNCFNMDAVHLRCRKAITVGALGPFEAAVDLDGGRGEGGFDQLVIWHPRDNDAVFRIARLFGAAGWQHCYTGDDRRGDQMIFTHPTARVRISMDVSYYAKRRIRLIPSWNRREQVCTPDRRAFPLNA